jgi:hydrogenase nickel incorporation protein HypA/HybF
VHELSIARALLRLAQQHRPPGAIVESLQVQVGPLQAIVPEALQLAWQAVTSDTTLAGVRLNLEMLPWRLRCPACNRLWDADSLDATCRCSSARGILVGGDELRLDYLEIAEPKCRSQSPTLSQP